MKLYTKQKQTHRHRKQTYSSQRGKEGGKEQIRSLGLTYTFYYTLLYSTGNYTQYFIVIYRRRESEKECLYLCVCMCVCVCVCACARMLFVIPWTVANQAPLPMGFSRQEYWNELSFPSPGDLPDPIIKLTSPALQVNSLPLSHQGSPVCCIL